MQRFTYNVDLVLCIDATASMRDIIDRCKTDALRFYEDMSAAMSEKDKIIDSLRIRVVAFRDYYVDGDMAMVESPFFTLPADRDAYASFIESIRAIGGGDEPENGLEALALAIQSGWTTVGDRRRQIIVVWTDASAHPLEKHADAKPVHYPASMPRDFDELTDLWDGQGPMSMYAKRLILYAPDATPWSDIANNWENVIQYPSIAGEGLTDHDYRSILDAIANSV